MIRKIMKIIKMNDNHNDNDNYNGDIGLDTAWINGRYLAFINQMW